jgi:branched-chain amino acid transport system permease protein
MTGTLLTGFLWIFLLEGVLRLYLPQGFETWRLVVYPLILLVMMLLRPEGLMGRYEIPFLRQTLPTPPDTSTKAKARESAESLKEVTV